MGIETKKKEKKTTMNLVNVGVAIAGLVALFGGNKKSN